MMPKGAMGETRPAGVVASSTDGGRRPGIGTPRFGNYAA